MARPRVALVTAAEVRGDELYCGECPQRLGLVLSTAPLLAVGFDHIRRLPDDDEAGLARYGLSARELAGRPPRRPRRSTPWEGRRTAPIALPPSGRLAERRFGTAPLLAQCPACRTWQHVAQD